MAVLRLQGQHSIMLSRSDDEDRVIALCEELWCHWRERYNDFSDAIEYAADHADNPGEAYGQKSRRPNHGRFDT